MKTLPSEDNDFPIMKERITDQYLPSACSCKVLDCKFCRINDRGITGKNVWLSGLHGGCVLVVFLLRMLQMVCLLK